MADRTYAFTSCSRLGSRRPQCRKASGLGRFGRSSLLISAGIDAGTLVSPGARADEPLFGFSYTTDLLPKRKFELEQWSTTRFTKIQTAISGCKKIAASRSGASVTSCNSPSTRSTIRPPPFTMVPSGQQHPRNSFRTINRAPMITSAPPGSSASPGNDLPDNEPLYPSHRHSALRRTDIRSGFIESESKLILQKNFRDDRLVFAANLTYAPEWRRLPNNS